MAVSIDWNELAEEARQDRRQGRRVNLNYQIEVRGADEFGAFYSCPARTRNVSKNGCCFETERKIKQGEVVSLQVMRRNPNGEKQTTRPLIFRICWVANEENLWIAGAEMTEQVEPWGIAFPPKNAPSKAPK